MKQFDQSAEGVSNGEVVLTEEILDRELPLLMSLAINWMYLNSDAELIELCATHDRHYSSSTSVTVLILAGYCCVGHLVSPNFYNHTINMEVAHI